MVPRTFLGPIVVSSLAYPAVMILKFVGSSKLWSQYVGNLHFMEYFFDISMTILHYYLKCNLETGHLAFTNLLTCLAYCCFNPLNSRDLISNSLYCQPYSSCDVSLENLGLYQLIIP